VKTNLWTLLSFYWAPGTFSDYGVPGHPFLDPLTGLLVLTGLVLTFFGLNRRVSWIAIGGMILGYASNSMSVMGENPSPSFIHGHRMFFMYPFVMILTARSFEWFWEMFDKGDRRMKAGLKRALVLGLAVFFTFNIYIYFFKFGNREQSWEPLGFHHIEQAKIFKQLRPKYHFLCDIDSFSPIVKYFADIESPQVTLVDDNLALPIPNQVTKDVALFVKTWKLPKIQEKIPKIYPHTVLTEYRNPWGNVHLRVYRIPRADIEAAQKGMNLAPPLP
jgi:hypothetical protein